MDLVIYGAGGLAREVAFLARDINATAGEERHRVLGYIDDDPGGAGREVGGLPVLGNAGWFATRTEPVDCVIGIGTPAILAAVSARLKAHDHVGFPNLVHPNVV